MWAAAFAGLISLGSTPVLAQSSTAGVAAAPDPAGTTGATSAQAAPEQTNTLGEIVVTASRRSESISRVPISVSAFNQAKLDTLSVKDIADLSRITPDVTFREGFGGSNVMSIRGISSTVGASTTGIYIDDTPIQARQMGTAQSATNVYPDVFDLERVEVLSGPQGTLFGAGSEGGTIRFILPSPSLTSYSAYARSEYSVTEDGSPSYEAGLAGGGPLIKDDLGFRASLYYQRDGGYVDRVPYAPDAPSEDNSNYSNTLSGRVAVTVAPVEGLSITPSVYYQRLYRNDSDLIWLNVSNPNDGLLRNGFRSGQPFTDRFWLPSLKVKWSAGPVDLFSNTSYYDRSYPFVNDYSTFILDLLTPLSPGYKGPSFYLSSVPAYDPLTYNFGGQYSFTQEFRVQSNDPASRLKWIVGGFYQHSEQTFDQYVYDPLLPQVTGQLFGLTPGQLLGDNLVEPGYGGVPQGAHYSMVGLERTLDEQTAGFGQLDFRVAGGLTVIGGVRVAATKFAFNISKNGPFNGGYFANAGETRETPVTPKFGFKYEIGSGHMLYATASKGFRPGGANPAVTSLCGRDLAALGRTQVPGSYQADTAWSYEIGSKNRLANGTVQLDVSGFYIDWQNIQQQIKLGTCGFDFIANLGAAVSKGFDLQVQMRPAAPLTLGADASYTDAAYTKTVFGGSNGQGLLVSAGDPLPVPRWHVTGSADYELWIADGVRGYVHGDYEFESAYVTTPGYPSVSYDPELYNAQSTHFATLRVGARTGYFDASFFVKNLLNSDDRLYMTRNDLSSELLQAEIFRPRTYGVTLTYRY